MADGKDPRIVIRTEYDPAGIKKLLSEARNAAKQLGIIQDKSVRDAQRAEDAKAKAAERALRANLRLQMNAGKEAAKELLNGLAAQEKARDNSLKAQARMGREAAKELLKQYDLEQKNVARGAAQEQKRANALFKQEEKARANRAKADAAALAAEQKRLDAEVRAVERAEDAKFKIRLANEQKIRAGLQWLNGAPQDMMAATTGSVNDLGGPNILKTMQGLLSGMVGPGSILGRIGSFVAGGLTGAATAFKDAMGAALNWIGKSIQVTIGVLLRDAALWFVHTIQNGIKTAVDSVAGVERLFISLTTQGTLENQSKGMNAADAMAAARREAAKYLQVVRELAIYSPFSVSDVQDIYRTYAAYGLTRGEAAKLTRGMIDLSSAFMVTGAEANRASLAVAQIIARGRATGEEIRQLVNSGLPLMTKLQEKLGVTKQEFANMAKEGKLTTEILLPALESLFKEFEGAGRRASMTTFTGLLSSLADIGPMLLQQFFGPINSATGEMEGLFGVLIPRLQQVVDFFTNPRTLGTIKDWGVQFGNAVKSAMDWAFGPIQTDVTKKVKKSLNQGQNAASWGYNLMVQYGNGIIRAGREVLKALANIGRMVMKFLKPHSPPLILPDIDDWGRETMEQWLLGFTQADANSVFSTLSSDLGGLMKGLLANVEDKAVLPGALMGLNEALGDLIKAYSGGTGLADIQSKIVGMFGAAAPVVQNYVTALLNAQTATTAVAAAERNLANVTKYYDNVLAGLDAQIKALQNTQQDITDDVEIRKLNLILNSQFTSADRKAMARARIEELRLTKSKRGIEEERDAKVAAAQAALDAAKLEQDKRNEQLAAAKMMLDFYQQQNDLLNDQSEALKDLAKALKEAAGAAGDAIDDLLSLMGGEDPYHGKQKAEKWDIFKPWRDEMTLFSKDWDEFWKGLEQGVNDFNTSYLVTVLTGVNPTSVMVADVTERNIERMKKAWSELPESVKSALLGGAVVGGLGAGGVSVMGTIGKFNIDLGDAMNLALADVQAAKSGIAMAFTILSTLVLISSAVIKGGVSGNFETMKTEVIGYVQDAKAEVIRLFGAWVVETETVFGPWYDKLHTMFQNVKTSIVDAMRDAYQQGAGYVNDMIGLINKLIEAYNSIPWLPDVASIEFIEIPSFQSQPGTPGKGSSGSTSTHTQNITNNYNLSVKTSNDPNLVQKSYNRMKVLGV